MSSAVQTLILCSFSPPHQPVDIGSHGAMEVSNQAFELCASEEKRARRLPGGTKSTNPRRRSAHGEITAFCHGKDWAPGPIVFLLALTQTSVWRASKSIFLLIAFGSEDFQSIPFCSWRSSQPGGYKKLAELQNNDLPLNTGSLGSLTRGSADGARGPASSA